MEMRHWRSGSGRPQINSAPTPRLRRRSIRHRFSGLIFLRFAEARFAKRREQLEKAGSSGRRAAPRIDDPAAYQGEGVFPFSPGARYDHLLGWPEGSTVGKPVNAAMADIEKHNPQLAGVLPRTYQFFNSTLLKELLKKVWEFPASLDYDAFGR